MVYRGEIYLVDLNEQIGSEQGGTRPAVIVQNDVGNLYSPTTIICPLTSKNKSQVATHVQLSPSDCGVVKDSTVLCEQLRVVDKCRLKKKLGEISNKRKIEDINKKIMISIGLL
jgi:mRNA interferase MazF